jgi:peptide/nickel transport system substrate-binding protein
MIGLVANVSFPQDSTEEWKILGAPWLTTPGVQGGLIGYPLRIPPITLNPYLLNPEAEELRLDLSSFEITYLLHATLLERHPLTGRAEPGLAKQTVIDDKSFTFHLRRGLRFSDGTPLTADDVVFTFNEILLNSSVKIHEGFRALLNWGGPPPIFAKAEKLDVFTVRVPANRLFAGLLELVLARLPVLPKHKLADKLGAFEKAWSLDSPPTEIVGAGPFQLTSISQDRKTFYLKRNPYYWQADEKGTRLPYLDGVVVVVAQNQEAELEKFKSSLTDIIRDLAPEQSASLAGQALFVYGEIVSYRTPDFLALNQDVADPAFRNLFRDVRFRHALAHASDRDSVIRRFPWNVPAHGFLYRPAFPIDPPIPYGFDLSQASKLLEGLGLQDKNRDGVRELPNGRALSFEVLVNQESQVRTALAEMLKTNLSRIGVRVQLRSVPLNTMTERLLAKPAQFEATTAALSLNLLNPLSLAALFASNGEFHFYRFSDASNQELSLAQRRIDQVFGELGTVSDIGKQVALLNELQKLLREDLPLIPLLWPRFITALRQDIKNGDSINLPANLVHFVKVLWREKRLSQ